MQHEEFRARRCRYNKNYWIESLALVSFRVQAFRPIIETENTVRKGCKHQTRHPQLLHFPPMQWTDPPLGYCTMPQAVTTHSRDFQLGRSRHSLTKKWCQKCTHPHKGHARRRVCPQPTQEHSCYSTITRFISSNHQSMTWMVRPVHCNLYSCSRLSKINQAGALQWTFSLLPCVQHSVRAALGIFLCGSI